MEEWVFCIQFVNTHEVLEVLEYFIDNIFTGLSIDSRSGYTEGIFHTLSGLDFIAISLHNCFFSTSSLSLSIVWYCCGTADIRCQSKHLLLASLHCFHLLSCCFLQVQDSSVCSTPTSVSRYTSLSVSSIVIVCKVTTVPCNDQT